MSGVVSVSAIRIDMLFRPSLALIEYHLQSPSIFLTVLHSSYAVFMVTRSVRVQTRSLSLDKENDRFQYCLKLNENA